tara:strand:+ start:699 stop:893 length:195 start_codon:yes stop_codon:yes gene_type:complete
MWLERGLIARFLTVISDLVKLFYSSTQYPFVFVVGNTSVEGVQVVARNSVSALSKHDVDPSWYN